MSRLCAIFVLTATLVSLTPEAAAGIGVLGDSYSDEYRFYPPHRSTGRNWVEILASTRGLDFGAYSETSRGEPRNQGYAFNWARSDATTDDMIASGQHTGVAAQVARGEVGLVCVFVGGNDFINALRSADPYSAVEAAPLRAAANFRKAVRTVLDASRAVRLVVATLPDVRDLPEFNGPVRDGRLPDTLADACTASIRRYNCEIRAVAASDPRVALLDLDLIARIVNLMSRESVTVGGRLLDRRRPSNDPGHFFLADARHPGTLGQGLMARMFVEAVNARFGAGIPPLTDREVAGLADTLAANPPGDPSIRLTSLAAYSVVNHVGQAARGTPRSLATLLPFPPVAAASGPRGVGTVFHNPGEAFGDTDLAALGGGKFSYRMMDLSLTHVGDGGLASIAGRHGLDTLDLFGTKVSDRGLAYLAGLSGLKALYLESTRVGDAGLVHLGGLTRLEILALSGTRVTDAGLVHLRGLTRLRALDLSYTAVTDAGVAALRRALPAAAISRLPGLQNVGASVRDLQPDVRAASPHVKNPSRPISDGLSRR